MYRFRECRDKSGLSQKFVALTLNVAAPSVANWERGKTSPTIENLIALADLYRVSIDYLVGRAESTQQIGIQLADDENILLERYRALGSEDKELLRSDALRMKREADKGMEHEISAG